MELANILELIHAVSDSDLTEFNLQDDTCLLYTSDAADE